jgi:lipopolysaccharide kinase (Kdo/WaaP) family protein
VSERLIFRAEGGVADGVIPRMISGYRVWGNIPPGFIKLVDARGCRLILRSDQEGVLSAGSWQDAAMGRDSTGLHGRGPLRRVKLPNGEVALLRRYHHGGLFRRLTGGMFFTWPPRPFRELMITEELRRRGIPTVEVYGACVEPVWGPFYGGWLATRAIPGAQDFWAALKSGFVRDADEERCLHAVARSVRAMHREGIYHADLNLKNILLCLDNRNVSAYIIDFDKAKLVLGDLPPRLAKNNLERFLRSARKLDPDRRYLSFARWDQFLDFYYHADGA